MRKLLIGLLVMVLIDRVYAQNLPYQHYSVADKLPSNICYRIIQDDKGFIWVATEKGISIFDGVVFKSLQTKNKLLNLDIWGLFKDRGHRIWLNSKQQGYRYILNDSVYNLNDCTGSSNAYQALVNYTAYPLIFKMDSSDNFIYDLNIQQKLVPREIPSEIKKNILESQKGYNLVYNYYTSNQLYLLFTKGKLLHYDFQTKRTSIRYFNGIVNGILQTVGFTPQMESRSYFECNDSIYYLCTDGLHFVTTRSRSALSKESIYIGKSRTTFFFRNGATLFATDSNLNRTVFNFPNIKATVSQVYEDIEHNLWFVTVGDGIYFVSNKNLKNKIYVQENGLLNNHIVSVAKGKQGPLYIGYYNQQAIQILKNDTFTSIAKLEGVGTNMTILEENLILIANQLISTTPITVQSGIKNIDIIQHHKYKRYITEIQFNVKAIYKVSDQEVIIADGNNLVRMYKHNTTWHLESITKTNAPIYAIAPLGK